ncbi:DUF2397 domain-containing protein [Thermomonospora catenispora]|uniref:DUF2397 domain-containing protein n=1 Tax=Thermomonospora catenispora TaxID=2493090 RepID=UPI001F4FFC42|nr:DUF2397 domain-containing protein [Thermomonospora catenispora]
MADRGEMKGQEPRPFAHLETSLAPLYRRIMRVFVDNKRRFVVHLPEVHCVPSRLLNL